jgi:hypothetical protein
MSRRPGTRSFWIVLLLAPGCYYALEDDADRHEASSATHTIVGPRGRSRSATWILVRAWSPLEEAPGEPPAGTPLEVESLKQDIHAAGMRVTLQDAPEAPHESILLKKAQSGFVAMARGLPTRAFEVAGRPVGGGAEAMDRGFELAVAPSPSGALRLVMAPLFRSERSTPADEVRVGALSFAVEVPNGRTFRIGGATDATHPAVRALFFDVSGERRSVWVNVEAFR